MPKRIVLKPTTGGPILLGIATTSRPTGIGLTSTMTARDIGGLDLDVTEIIYNNYVKPFVYDNPLYMGSTDKLVTIYNSIDISIQTANETNKSLLILLRDTMLVLLRTSNTYYEFLRSENELKTIEKKYKLSLDKITSLERQISKINADDADGGMIILEGELGIQINQPKNLIYAQALLNLNYAWYQYLHGTMKIDPRLLYSTKQYVESLGEKQLAYNKLIELLDQKYATLKDDIKDVQNEEIIESA